MAMMRGQELSTYGQPSTCVSHNTPIKMSTHEDIHRMVEVGLEEQPTELGRGLIKRKWSNSYMKAY